MYSSILENFIYLSRKVGQRGDLVQAGGGNISAHSHDGRMFIKASGYLLSEITPDRGYLIMDKNKAISIIDAFFADMEKQHKESAPEPDDSLIRKLLERSVIERYPDSKRNRAILECPAPACRTNYSFMSDSLPFEARLSIEVFLHILFDGFVVHAHPVSVNALACRKNWKELILHSCRSLPYTGDFLFVDYATPGIKLARSIMKKINGNSRKKIQVIFLKNHGIVVSAGSPETTLKIMDEICITIEKETGLDFSHYRTATHLSDIVNSVADAVSGKNLLVFPSEDRILMNTLEIKRESFFVAPCMPDTLVYCGEKPLLLERQDVEENSGKKAIEKIKNYQEQYHEFPRVIILDSRLFMVANSFSSARQIEEVLRAHIIALGVNADSEIECLSEKEMSYLKKWEVERRRRDRECI